MNRRFSPRLPQRLRGLTLIEIMIALVLGLMIVGGALMVFISNRQTYLVSDSLGRIQENARVTFELMSRDLRVAGGNPCQAGLPVVNVMTNAGTAWWSSPAGVGADFVEGFDEAEDFTGAENPFGTAVQERVDGTDAMQLISAVSDGLSVASHNKSTAQFTANVATHGLAAGDVAMVCDFQNVAIFQVSSVAGSLINHAAGAGTPGNSTKELGPAGATYRFGCFLGRTKLDNVTCDDDPDGDPAREWPAYLARVQGVRWFVGYAPDGSQSLYRAAIGGDGVVDALEIAENVAGFTLTYLEGNAYVDAASVVSWNAVDAVRVTLQLQSDERMALGTGPERLQREFVSTISLRSRVQ